MYAKLSALQNIDQHRTFTNKTVHQQVNLLNDIILNTFKMFVPNKVITCDDRDPPQRNDNIENKNQMKKIVCTKIIKEIVKKLRTARP